MPSQVERKLNTYLPERRPFSLWLRPTSAQRSDLLGIIECLRKRFGTPRFEPHSTLLSGYASVVAIREGLAYRVRQVCKGLGPVTLQADGLGQTDQRFTFFFLRMKGHGFMTTCSGFAGIAPRLQAPAVGPHISLIYGEVCPEIDRAAIREEILAALPIQVTFDAIQIVTPRDGCWNDVQGWESGIPIPLDG